MTKNTLKNIENIYLEAESRAKVIITEILKDYINNSKIYKGLIINKGAWWPIKNNGNIEMDFENRGDKNILKLLWLYEKYSAKPDITIKKRGGLNDKTSYLYG